MNISGNQSVVRINGREFHGNNISISGDRVIVDGVEQSGAPLGGPITVHVAGDCGNIQTASGNITVQGSVNGDVRSASGDVRCGDVRGSVQTMSGDVNCDNVGGPVRSMSGDVSRRR